MRQVKAATRGGKLSPAAPATGTLSHSLANQQFMMSPKETFKIDAGAVGNQQGARTRTGTGDTKQ